MTLVESEAWIDVVWPSDALAGALAGQRVRSQIDFPFLSDALIVVGSESLGTSTRFHCVEDAEDIRTVEKRRSCRPVGIGIDP